MMHNIWIIIGVAALITEYAVILWTLGERNKALKAAKNSEERLKDAQNEYADQLAYYSKLVDQIKEKYKELSKN